MRFAKFFFGLLFGVAVIVTFFKMLFFFAFLLALAGGVFFLSRIARRMLAGTQDSQWYGTDQPQRGFFQSHTPSAALPIQPMDAPGYAPQRTANRIIEVL